jgi:hypothetical protein
MPGYGTGALYALRLATILVTCAFPCAVSADTTTTKITEVNTNSGIRATHFYFGHVHEHTARNPGDATPQVLQTRSACVSFENTDARTAEQITFHFVYYDTLNNHAGDTDLVRAGKFTQGTVIESVNAKTNLINDEDCVAIPYHQQGVALVVMFVTSVTYADNSVFTTSGPAIPEHLDN